MLLCIYIYYTCCIIQSHTYLLTTHSLPSAVRTGRYLIIEPINVEAQTNYRHNSSVFADRSRCGCDLQNMELHAILMNSSHVVCDCSQLVENLITLRYVHSLWPYKYYIVCYLCYRQQRKCIFIVLLFCFLNSHLKNMSGSGKRSFCCCCPVFHDHKSPNIYFSNLNSL